MKRRNTIHNRPYKYRHLGLITGLLFLLLSQFSLAGNQPKAAYYRYIDANGVANISRSVTPTHIRKGYDALDRNMYVLYKVAPYNVEADLKQESHRAAQSLQQRKDAQLLRSYRNSQYATEKKKEILSVTKKQLDQQYQQLRTMQADRVKFLQQRSDAILNQQPVPASLQQNLNNNKNSIESVRITIEQLKTLYAEQEQQYDMIIKRLIELEARK